MESLGQLAKISADITAHLVGAVAVAAEYHRIDGLPDPATGRGAARPSDRRDALDLCMADAVALIKPALAACHNAATFTEAAELRAAAARIPVRRADPMQAPSEPPKLTDHQHRALHLIQTQEITLWQWPRKRPTVSTGTQERITFRSVDALEKKELIRTDRSALYSGQRLRITEAGRRALDRLGPAPAPAPVPHAQPRLPGLARTR